MSRQFFDGVALTTEKRSKSGLRMVPNPGISQHSRSKLAQNHPQVHNLPKFIRHLLTHHSFTWHTGPFYFRPFPERTPTENSPHYTPLYNTDIATQYLLRVFISRVFVIKDGDIFSFSRSADELMTAWRGTRGDPGESPESDATGDEEGPRRRRRGSGLGEFGIEDELFVRWQRCFDGRRRLHFVGGEPSKTGRGGYN